LPGHGALPNKLYGARGRDWQAEAREGLATLRKKCDRVFIMAHSMGNVLGANLVMDNDDILGMIMLAPITELPDRRLRLLRVLKYVMPWFYPLWMKSLHPVVYERLHEFDPTIDLEDPAVRQQLPELTRVPTAAIDEMSKLVESGRPLWRRLDLPVVIFQGKRDILVDYRDTEALLQTLPNVDKQLFLFDEGLHELMRPFDPTHEQVWPAVIEFIDGHKGI
jgi:esterase/lipase